LWDRARRPHHSPTATPAEVVSKVLYLRQRYHFGPGKIADYLKRFHDVSRAVISCQRTNSPRVLSSARVTGEPICASSSTKRLVLFNTGSVAGYVRFGCHPPSTQVRADVRSPALVADQVPAGALVAGTARTMNRFGADPT